MDHCFTEDVKLDRTKRRRDGALTQQVLITTEPDQRSFITGEGREAASEITLWFCQFLRSYFRCAELMMKKNLEGEDGASCEICDRMTKHIRNRCHSAYLDGKCLNNIHKDHLDAYGFISQARVNVIQGTEPAILAHYHPEGVFFKIFPLHDGEYTVGISFPFC